MDAGLFIVRFVFGALMAVHGSQKLFGWFGGYGLAGTGGFFEGLGFRPGPFFAAAAGLAETLGGLLLVVGLFEPVGAMAVISVMIVAIGSAHWGHGLLATTNGGSCQWCACRREISWPSQSSRSEALSLSNRPV